MSCSVLNHNDGLRSCFKSHRFVMLHPDGRKLIAHWFRLAQKQLDCDPADSFEPFIYAWFALNGWAACCTEKDQDRQIILALSACPELMQKFDQSLTESAEFRATAERFRSFMPVFKVQELRRKRIRMHNAIARDQMIAHYFAQGAEKFAPDCFQTHAESGEAIPLDWPHVLAAIYQVRCNLFHGDKAPHSEIDRVLVHSAFQILVQFLSRWQYMP